MKKQFIPYEQALKLEELGFDEECISIYLTSTQQPYPIYRPYKIKEQSDELLRPLWQQAFDWFRDKHNMLANVYSNASGFLYEYHDTIGGTHRFDSGFTGDCEDSGTFTSFQKAQLACLDKLIEIVEQQQKK